jgi:hypothetical protein
MKSRAVSNFMLAGLVLSFLSAGVAKAAGSEGNERMSRAPRADAVEQRRAQTRHEDKFKSEKTNSWLCSYVSPFFCDAFPTLTTSEQPPQTIPNRARH